ncbi:MAG: hypothetical protein IPI23_01720 [Bacteroidetes bacterium]|nr:hypothetical protein [Bacteroidota bacterium]
MKTIVIFMAGLLFFTLASITSATAQYTSNPDKEAEVHSILVSFIQSDAFNKFRNKHYPDSKGSIEMELVLKGKKVESIFVKEAHIEPVPFINAFSNFIKDMTFEFKLAKGQRLKIIHTFEIN